MNILQTQRPSLKPQKFHPLHIASKASLAKLLERNHIAWREWNPKGIDHLWHELEEGDCTLTKQHGHLTRMVDLAIVWIQHKLWDNRKLILFEDKQIFSNGQLKVINTSGVREKKKRDESITSGAKRGLHEELRIPMEHTFIQPLGKPYQEEKPSQTFSGLSTKKNIHVFLYEMPEKYFCYHGYQERQKDKTIFFSWRE